jgi:pimeloyl-ACP methyl ester carboxylesterase
MKRWLKSISLIIILSLILIIAINYLQTLIIDNSLEAMPNNIAKIDNVNINYKITGNESNPPILLIHGLFSSSDDYNNLAKRLSDKYRVVSVDLIGFGLSDKRDNLDYNTNTVAKLCKDLMNNLGYKKFSVLGHSMGGGIALLMALNHQDSIDKLILVDSTGLGEHVHANPPKFIIKEGMLTYFPQLAMYSLNFNNPKYINYDTFEKNLFYNRQLDSSTVEKLLDNCKSIDNLKDRLKDIHTKTLIIWGAKDNVLPVDNAYTFNDQIKDSKLSIISNCGHMPFAESEDLFVKELISFMSS